MTTELFLESNKADDFLRRHYPPARDWIDPMGWCAWYISNGFMATLYRNDQSIAAMAAVRPVNCPEDGDIPFKYAKDGDCLFVDFMAIDDHSSLALPGFTMLFMRRFGDRKQVAYIRKRVHDYENFVRNFGRFNISKIGEPDGTKIPAITP